MNDPTGSKWRKWDLHFHTPKSFDHASKGLSAAEVVDRLITAEVEVVAVTDHHRLDVEFITQMRAAAGSQLTILPGIELSCPLGGKEGVHFIGIFPENSNLEYLASQLLSSTGISSLRAAGKAEEQIYVDFIPGVKAIRDLKGIVSVHAHAAAAEPDEGSDTRQDNDDDAEEQRRRG